MTRAAVLAGIAACSAPATAPAVAPIAVPAVAPPVEPAGPVTRIALVWADAPLYFAPDPHAQAIKLADLAARKPAVGAAIPMQVIARAAGFLELAPLPDAACGWLTLHAPDDFSELRVFVRHPDLAPVLTRPVGHTFADGTRFALEPGVAVSPPGDGDTGDGYLVSIGGSVVSLPIPDDAVGELYTAAAPAPTADAHAAPSELDNFDAQLGHASFRYREHVEVAERATTEPSLLVPVHAACRDLVLRVHAADLGHGLTTSGHGTARRGAGHAGPEREHDYLPAGTELRISGFVVARTAQVIVLPDDHGEQACVDGTWSLAFDDARHPELVSRGDQVVRACAASTAVVHGPLPP